MRFFIFTVTLFLTAVLVQGCAVAAAGSAAAGGYYVTKDKRKLGTITSDATISTRVKMKFITDHHVRAWNINVDTYSSVVTLHGNVPSDAVKGRAIQLAKSVKGVKKIITRLVTAPPLANN